MIIASPNALTITNQEIEMIINLSFNRLLLQLDFSLQHSKKPEIPLN